VRYSIDLFFLGLVGAVAAWAGRAPSDPPARAGYLCAPVVAVARTALALEAALSDDGLVIPPMHPRFDPERSCTRLVLLLAADEAS
jgi:hypothetical protein